MKHLNHLRPFVLLLATVLLAGCTFSLTKNKESEKNYTIKKSKEEPKYSIVEMKTFDPASSTFIFEFDRKLWKIEEWEEEKAPNRVAIVHKNYEEKKCFILPGTIGLGKDEASQIIEGSFLTSRYVGRTLTITHPAGYVLKEIVGYEVDEIPYIFELNLPVGGADTCKQDAQFVMASFDIVEGKDSAPAKTVSP